MSKNDINQENLKKYQEHLRELGTLTPPAKEPTIDDLAKEGQKLLEPETPKVKSKKKSDSSIPPASKDNPYLKARNQILAKYPEWRKNEILAMERDNNKDNRYYMQFVRDCRELGDSF